MLSDNKCDLTLRDKKIVLPLDKGHFITGREEIKDCATSKALCFEEKELYAILDTDRIILNSSYDGKESEACMNTLDLYLSTEYPDFTTTTQVQSR